MGRDRRRKKNKALPRASLVNQAGVTSARSAGPREPPGACPTSALSLCINGYDTILIFKFRTAAEWRGSDYRKRV